MVKKQAIKIQQPGRFNSTWEAKNNRHSEKKHTRTHGALNGALSMRVAVTQQVNLRFRHATRGEARGKGVW